MICHKRSLPRAGCPPMRRRFVRSLPVALLVLLVGCQRPASQGASSQPSGGAEKPGHPILLVGVDGLEWSVVLPMVREGRLPNLAQLMSRGTFGKLETFRPTFSPVIWTSIATGVDAQRHGILGFVHKGERPDPSPRLYTSLDRTVKAFWNILTDDDRRVHVVGWWMTYPVEPINGIMVAQTNSTDSSEVRSGVEIWKGAPQQGLDQQVHPPDRQAELLSILPAVEQELPELTSRIFGDFTHPLGAVPRRLWDNCLWAFRADEIYRRISLKLLHEDASFDAFAVYLGGTDVAGHRFWRYLRPRCYARQPTAEELQNFGDVIPAYYAYIDGVIGELLQAAPPDCNTIVVTDHGMVPINRNGKFTVDLPTGRLNSGGHGKAPPGVFLAAGPDIRGPENTVPLGELTQTELPLIGSVFDITPTLLALLRVPVGRDMTGRVLTNVIEPAFLAENPIAWVDSHTPADWRERRARRATRPIESAERLRQLRELGYIDDSGDLDIP